ncbi:PepSY domain-containing protein [Terrabacter sp. MAHUQ-38]|uniref:PepSY-associated TM helix domain-containing protein n=1 Tax=unclassified Terrabacter TaxID=2630222 RepID=UPI00165DB1C4|nr:PepSY domain-containing protein [Terrabacter sp. MAHUQ-38]MBC9820833.1 PepSY domain-containing protein [Terrabacter sp. MAHUQ-38]
MSVVDDTERPTRLKTLSRKGPRPTTGLFRAFWRWHFYASVVVVPVLLVLAVTGLVYLFRFQIEPFVNADLMRVEHAQGQLSQPLQTQLEAVESALPGATLVSVTEPTGPDDSTRFTIETAEGLTRDVFVDPYTVRVLGSLDPDSTISGTAVRLHADLMAGRVGDVVMELGACWAIVMAVTGYYLLVRGRRARRRQREAGAPGARLRTTHARTGAFVGAGLLLLVVSGLPWTGVWGEQVQRLATDRGSSIWAQDPGALSDPTSTLDESLPHSHAVPWAQGRSPVPQSNPRQKGDEVSVANLDTAVEVADRAGLAHPFTVALPSGDPGVYSVIGYAFTDPGLERTLHVDRFGGQVVSAYGYDDYPALAKVVAQGIAVHEGRRFGAVNLWLTTFFCLAVIVACVTGPVMWWRRRPRGAGAVGAPRGRMPLAGSPLLAVLVVGLALLLPVFGASLVVILLLDRFVIRRIPRLRHAFTVADR